MARLDIDFTTVEATSSPEPLATGWYRAVVSESEEKPTSNNATTGNSLIAVKFTLIDPAFKQRPVFKNFNFKNTNQQAQDIGWGEMKALSEALGFANGVQDTIEWHNKPVLIHVKLKAARQVPVDPMDASKGFKEYDASNDINGFKPISDTSVQIISAPAAAQSTYTPPTSFVNGMSPVASVGTAWNPASTQAAPIQPALPANPVVVQQSAPPAFAAPAPAPTPAPVVAAAPTYEMTAKAGGATREQFEANGWTVELMIKEGYMVEVKPVAAPLPVTPAQPAAIPTASLPSSTNAPSPAQPAQSSGGAVPPWLAGQQ